MTFTEWYLDYCKNRTERLGQAFCNDFIIGDWSELYYAENSYDTYCVIYDWLDAHSYIQTGTMPEKIK